MDNIRQLIAVLPILYTNVEGGFAFSFEDIYLHVIDCESVFLPEFYTEWMKKIAEVSQKIDAYDAASVKCHSKIIEPLTTQISQLHLNDSYPSFINELSTTNMSDEQRNIIDQLKNSWSELNQIEIGRSLRAVQTIYQVQKMEAETAANKGLTVNGQPVHEVISEIISDNVAQLQAVLHKEQQKEESLSLEELEVLSIYSKSLPKYS